MVVARCDPTDAIVTPRGPRWRNRSGSADGSVRDFAWAAGRPFPGTGAALPMQVLG